MMMEIPDQGKPEEEAVEVAGSDQEETENILAEAVSEDESSITEDITSQTAEEVTSAAKEPKPVPFSEEINAIVQQDLQVEDILEPGGQTSDLLADETPAEETEQDDGRAWYVVHCYSGYENKVRHNLEQRIETMGMKDEIFDVVVPTEEEIEVKEGKRRTVERRVFPGYILVNLILSEESWYVVRNTPGVTGFVGMGSTPTPLRSEEVSQIIKRMEADAPRIKVTFKSGERVRIVDGPFNDFRGTVDEIDMERAKVRVMVNFFGRETPIELDFLQVEKA
jgi:transcriptional antiterminator NusG